MGGPVSEDGLSDRFPIGMVVTEADWASGASWRPVRSILKVVFRVGPGVQGRH